MVYNPWLQSCLGELWGGVGEVMQVKKIVGVGLFILTMRTVLFFYARSLGVEFNGDLLAVYGYQLILMFYGATLTVFALWGRAKCK